MITFERLTQDSGNSGKPNSTDKLEIDYYHHHDSNSILTPD